jgi:hypothetical protein
MLECSPLKFFYVNELAFSFPPSAKCIGVLLSFVCDTPFRSIGSIVLISVFLTGEMVFGIKELMLASAVSDAGVEPHEILSCL